MHDDYMSVFYKNGFYYSKVNLDLFDSNLIPTFGLTMCGSVSFPPDFWLCLTHDGCGTAPIAQYGSERLRLNFYLCLFINTFKIRDKLLVFFGKLSGIY